MKLQQGDIILKSVDEVKGNDLGHLTLASSQVTGHSHTIKGRAVLLQDGNDTFLEVLSPSTLTHEEHADIPVPVSKYQVIHVREMDWLSEEERMVVD
jgi:hypothetical protein